jgi:choline kinase
MLKIGEKTLLDRQVNIYRVNGINKIFVVRGYKGETINYDSLRYFDNSNYEHNNVLNSLFCAEEELNGEVIVAYSDILFESVVVSRLLQSKADISIVVNIDWRSYYIGRKDHPIEEAEKVVFSDHYDVVKIGKVLKETNDRCGEFIGMMKLSPRGSQIFKRHFHRARELFWDSPYHQAKTFQKAYITDMIQDMVDLGVPINCVLIEGGSREIDTVEDYEKALKDYAR